MASPPDGNPRPRRAEATAASRAYPGQVLAQVLEREGRALVQRLRLWTPARYAAAAPPWGSRGDLILHLAQSLADLAAGLESRPVRPLPRLGGELVRADQLAVTCADAVAVLGNVAGAQVAEARPVAADPTGTSQRGAEADRAVAREAHAHDASARDAVAHLLTHRSELLGDEVPTGLAAALGLVDAASVLAHGRAVCHS